MINSGSNWQKKVVVLFINKLNDYVKKEDKRK
jgi:hypothetical protein